MAGPLGKYLWMDIIVPEAETVRNFFTAEVGWTCEGTGISRKNDVLVTIQDPAGVYIGLYGKE